MKSMRAIQPVLIRFALFSGTVLCLCNVGVVAQSQTASQEPLGDVVRQQRTTPHPKAKRVVTDEDVATLSAPISQSHTDKSAAVADDAAKKASPEDKEKERAKPFLEAIETQKKRIAEAQKKIEDLNSERRQRASAQYADMGLLLRDPQKWNQDEKAIQDEIAKKQSEIDDAKGQLEQARESARKNGVRVSD